MAKGREASASAEKPARGIQADIDNFRNKSDDYDDYFEGIIIPERPSKKAIEELKKGKPVAFT